MKKSCCYLNCNKGNVHILCRRFCCILMGIPSYRVVRKIHQDSVRYNFFQLCQDHMLLKNNVFWENNSASNAFINAKSSKYSIPMHRSPIRIKFEQQTPTLKQETHIKNNKQNHFLRSSFYISSHMTLPTHVRVNGNRARTHMNRNRQ